jgi:hypothetical protein
MGIAALITWLITALGGFYLLYTWISKGGPRQPSASHFPPGLIFGHFALAAIGLVLWIIYLIVCAATPQRVPGVGDGADDVQREMDESGTERGGAGRKGEEVEQPDARGRQRADDADHDQPRRRPDQVRRLRRRPRSEVEHETRHPGTDRDRDQDRMERMAVRTGEQGAHRMLRRRLSIGHRASLFH